MIVDNAFVYVVATYIMLSDGIEPRSVNEYSVRYKWIFLRKRNEKNEIGWYKARIMAQGPSQRPEIDYGETYSPAMDVIMFRYLIGFVVSKKLNMQPMI